MEMVLIQIRKWNCAENVYFRIEPSSNSIIFSAMHSMNEWKSTSKPTFPNESYSNSNCETSITLKKDWSLVILECRAFIFKSTFIWTLISHVDFVKSFWSIFLCRHWMMIQFMRMTMKIKLNTYFFLFSSIY